MRNETASRDLGYNRNLYSATASIHMQKATSEQKIDRNAVGLGWFQVKIQRSGWQAGSYDGWYWEWLELCKKVNKKVTL